MKKTKSIDILPSDNEIEKRKDRWEDFLETTVKNTRGDNAEELNLSLLSQEISDQFDPLNSSDDDESVNEEDGGKAIPQALEAIKEPISDHEELDKAQKELQLAVQKRQRYWKANGIQFNFSKVEKWLKESHQEEIVENITGDSRHYSRLQKSKSHKALKSFQSNGKNAPLSHSRRQPLEQLSAYSNSDDNSSVDTAKYIRANQKQKTRTVVRKTTIIKEYFESNKTHRAMEERQRLTIPRPTLLPIEESKRKRRRTRGERNRLFRSFTQNSASDTDESNFRPRETPKKGRKHNGLHGLDTTKSSLASDEIPLNEMNKQLEDKVVVISSSSESVCTPANLQNGSNAATFTPTTSRLRPRLKCSVQTSRKKPKPSAKVAPFQDDTKQMTPHDKKVPMNESLQSIKDLPKEIVMYSPGPNTNNVQNAKTKVKFTNQHIEEVLGKEWAKQILKKTEVNKEIDATDEVVLEIPSSTSSEDDILETFQKRAQLKLKKQS